MSDRFFASWDLWEQMTFVLAGAIVLVFCVGWARLWWVSRRIKRTAVVDEEKRIRIQELRRSGIIIKLDRENPIPFGIRALQSGTEIDGIWVSTSSTPISENLKQLRESKNSSDSSFGSNDDGRPLSAAELSPPRIPFSAPPQLAFRPGRISIEQRKTIEEIRPSTIRTSPRDLTAAYKPRRSSQLRFSSSGGSHVNQDALSRLEGVAPMIQEQGPHDGQNSVHAAVIDSLSDAATDTERSPGSDSGYSISGARVILDGEQNCNTASTGAASKRFPRKRSHGRYNSDEYTSSTQLSSMGDYLSVPRGSPLENENPFATPNTSPTLGSISTRAKTRLSSDEIEALGETRWPLLSGSPTESLTEPGFTPGTLHSNKTARKINSGFELLPAGTFDRITGADRNFTYEATALADSVEGDQRRESKKLQKRRRKSITGKRTLTVLGKH